MKMSLTSQKLVILNLIFTKCWYRHDSNNSLIYNFPAADPIFNYKNVIDLGD